MNYKPKTCPKCGKRKLRYNLETQSWECFCGYINSIKKLAQWNIQKQSKEWELKGNPAGFVGKNLSKGIMILRGLPTIQYPQDIIQK